MLAMTAAVACDQGTSSVRTATNAPPDARSITSDTDVTIASPPDAATSDTGVVVAVDWSGLGVTGWGAAYGASPLDPATRDIGLGERSATSVELLSVRPSSDALLRVFRAKRSELEQCVRVMSDGASANEPIVLTVVVRPERSGTVRDVAVQGARSNLAFERCVMQRFRDLTAPRLRAAAAVAVYRVTRVPDG